jgi:hypothetical protein
MLDCSTIRRRPSALVRGMREQDIVTMFPETCDECRRRKIPAGGCGHASYDAGLIDPKWKGYHVVLAGRPWSREAEDGGLARFKGPDFDLAVWYVRVQPPRMPDLTYAVADYRPGRGLSETIQGIQYLPTISEQEWAKLKKAMVIIRAELQRRGRPAGSVKFPDGAALLVALIYAGAAVYREDGTGPTIERVAMQIHEAPRTINRAMADHEIDWADVQREARGLVDRDRNQAP